MSEIFLQSWCRILMNPKLNEGVKIERFKSPGMLYRVDW